MFFKNMLEVFLDKTVNIIQSHVSLINSEEIQHKTSLPVTLGMR